MILVQHTASTSKLVIYNDQHYYQSYNIQSRSQPSKVECSRIGLGALIPEGYVGTGHVQEGIRSI